MKFIRVDADQAIATVTLNHAGGNRINFEMREEILEAVQTVAASRARVLVIRGEGPDFCLGGDIRDWPGIPSASLRPRVEVYARAIDALAALRIPTIAAVHGACMGGGFELALSCDLVVAARSARFMFPEALLGIMTLQGGVYELAERIGRSKAIELVFLPHQIHAEQMLQWNVVNRMFEDDRFDSEMQAVAEQLAQGPAEAYAATKELMHVWRLQGRAAAARALYDISMPLFDSAAVQEALAAAAAAVNKGQPIPQATFR